MAALASLGFANGPKALFRIDPTDIEIEYDIHTSVQDTVGGRVVQITGATVGDIVITGTVGQDVTATTGGYGVANAQAGSGYVLAVDFYNQINALMNYQSAKIDLPNTAIPAATFQYAPLNLNLPVYIKQYIDPDGDGTSGVYNRSGKFLFRYQLTLFPAQDNGTVLVQAGQNGSTFDQAKANAISSYLNRITSVNGIGWRLTVYNGTEGPEAQAATATAATGSTTGTGSAAAGAPTGSISSAGAISVSEVTYGQYNGGGNLAGWVTAACAAAGVPYNTNWLNGYTNLVRNESSGNPNAVNDYDSNATGADVADGYPANCSRGIAQCIPPTFAEYHASGTSTDIYDPTANIAASINYVRSVYGVSSDGSNFATQVSDASDNNAGATY